MKKLAQRTVIAGAGVLAIASAVGGTALLGQAHADDPQCVASVTAPCAQQVPPPADPPHRTHIRVFCQPGGLRATGNVRGGVLRSSPESTSIRARSKKSSPSTPHEASDLSPAEFSQRGRCAGGAESIRANAPVAAVVATNLRTAMMSRRTLTRCHRASTITLGGIQPASG
jgi:hypothetical protein